MFKKLKSIFATPEKQVNEAAIKERYEDAEHFTFRYPGPERVLYGTWSLDAASLNSVEKDLFAYGVILEEYRIFDLNHAFSYKYGLLNKPRLRFGISLIHPDKPFNAKEQYDKAYFENSTIRALSMNPDKSYHVALTTLRKSKHSQAPRLLHELETL